MIININHQLNTYGSLYLDAGSCNMNWNNNVVRNSTLWLILLSPKNQNDTIENNFYDNKKQMINKNCIAMSFS
jgi:hypothetical protein